MTGGSLMMSLVVSGAGYVAFSYGKRQRRAPQLLVGLTLMIFPYFVDSPLLMFAIACGLLFALWLVVQLGW